MAQTALMRPGDRIEALRDIVSELLSMVLVNLGQRGRFDISAWGRRVTVIDAKCAGSWELPVLGPVVAPDV